MGRTWTAAALGLGLLAGLAGCLGGTPAGTPDTGGPAAGGGTSASGGTSGGGVRLVFWHTRRGEQEKLIQELCTQFAQENPGVTLVPEYQGSYADLNKKLRASIQAKSLPALAVAYESNVAEYMANDVVRPLDDLVKDPEIGFKPEELAQIPAPYLDSNRFAKFSNQLLSFPFTKSNLVLYYNKTLLKKAGFDAPPGTWAEFEKQAAALTRVMKTPAFLFWPDASTLDGMIYSFGGDVLASDQKTTLFDQPATVKAFELLHRMARAKTLVEVNPNDVAGLFNGQRAALVLDSSSGRARSEQEIGSKFDWDIAVIPHDDGVKPVTVMYGGNICLFKGSPEQERAAWKFVKWFVSPAVTGRWARETGYLPVTRASVELPEMKAFYEGNLRAQHVYDALTVARGEPNVVGWQEARDLLEEAARSVVSGTAPAAAAAELKQKADQAIAQSQ